MYSPAIEGTKYENGKHMTLQCSDIPYRIRQSLIFKKKIVLEVLTIERSDIHVQHFRNYQYSIAPLSNSTLSLEITVKMTRRRVLLNPNV